MFEELGRWLASIFASPSYMPHVNKKGMKAKRCE